MTSSQNPTHTTQPKPSIHRNPDWTQKKIDAQVPFPQLLDLSTPIQGSDGISLLPPGGIIGLQPGEAPLPEESSPPSLSSSSSSSSSPFQFDQELLASLTSFGFPLGACKRAMVSVVPRGGGAEEAVEWLTSHIEDENFGNDYVEEDSQAAAEASVSTDSNAAQVATLCEMGFSEAAVRSALAKCSNSVERAMDWLFSHPEGGEAPPADAPGSSTASSSSNSPHLPHALPPTPENSSYELAVIVSHMGASPSSGHYIAHIKKEGEWLIFNDSKVAVSKNPPLEAGFMYLYKRVPRGFDG